MSKNFLFVGGLTKSGTTLLQHVIDLHPEACCLIEQDLSLLLHLFNSENDAIKPYVEKGFDLKKYFPSLIEKILEKNCSKKIKGLNDNKFLIDNIYETLQLFESSKIIFIVRNPYDNFLSAWDHRKRLYKLKVIPKLGNKDDFFIERAVKWKYVNEKIYESSKRNPERIMIIRYEDMISNKRVSIERICYFLGLSSDKEIIENILDKSTIDKMKVSAKDETFFKKARTDFGRSSNMSDNIRTQIDNITIEVREFFKYT